ncbi:hypothetical protein [Streptomyces apocyni]|uniref:hypothetical protein n=1 Tax=Streptomyces apocyni TaxID=2654677 RepID=UPI0012EA17C3|nr:hypothetical protein [Streptomyces apocyni]
MSNQPYDPYDDPYQQDQHHQHHQQQPYQPHQPYPPQPEPQWPADSQWPTGQQMPGDSQQTQTWQAQTWETSVQPPVAPTAPAAPAAPLNAAETAYLPQQASPEPVIGPEHGYAPFAQPLAPEQPYGAAAHAYPTHASEAPAPTSPHTAAHPRPDDAAAAGPGYGPATTTGNPRITDAQRARAEGRSPIIAPGMQPAALTAVLALLLAGGAAIGSYALLVPLVLLQAVTAAGWFRLNGMWPARQGIALAFLGGVVADAVLLGVGREHAPAAILGTLGGWVLLTLVLQLRSRAGADERMYGLMATVASAALAILAAGHLGAEPAAISVGAVAVAAAVLARALPLPGVASVVVALLAAAGAGIVAGQLTGVVAQGAALLGLGAGVCALVGLRVASYDYPSRFVHMTAGVALPLALAAPAVYVLGRVVA